jgi:uncharacterized membrane protein
MVLAQYGYAYGGWWWFIGMILIVFVIWFAASAAARRRVPSAPPMSEEARLNRRLANGEITPQEYVRRLAEIHHRR